MATSEDVLSTQENPSVGVCPPADGKPTGQFGLTTLTCVVIASMIGSGVFTTSGFSLAALGSPVRVLIAWAIGGCVAITGAIAYGELARRLPVSGGEYLYLSRRLHPFAGFLAGWVSLTAGFSGAIAMAAMTFETYAVPDTIRPAWLPVNAVALLSILVFGMGHAFLVRPFAAVQNAVVFVKLLILAVFLLVAASRLESHTWFLTETGSDLPDFWTPASIAVMASSVMWISLSYAGFNAAVYLASEVREPHRTVPASLWLGTVLVTVLYLALNAVFVSAAPIDAIAGQKEIAALSAGAIGGRSLDLLIRSAISLGTLSSVAGMIMTGPRVFSRMADDGLFPQFFRSGPQSVNRTVLFQTALAGTLVLVSSLRLLLDYLSTTLALSSALTVMTLLLPEKASESPADFRRNSWFRTACAVFYVLMTLLTAALMAWHRPNQLQGTVLILLTGTVLWFVGHRVRPASQPKAPNLP